MLLDSEFTVLFSSLGKNDKYFHFLFIYGRVGKPFEQLLGDWTIKLSTESNTNKKKTVGG